MRTYTCNKQLLCECTIDRPLGEGSYIILKQMHATCDVTFDHLNESEYQSEKKRTENRLQLVLHCNRYTNNVELEVKTE